MDNDTPEEPTIEGPKRRGWSTFKVPLIALLGVALLFGVLTAVERTSGSTTVKGTAAANTGGTDAFFARAPKSANPGAGDQIASQAAAQAADAATKQAASLANPDEAVAAADVAANAARTAINAAAPLAAAAGTLSRRVDPAAVAAIAPQTGGAFGQVCATLIATKARVDAQIRAIIAQFPFLAGVLDGVLAAVDAQINALLGRFGCTVSGGA